MGVETELLGLKNRYDGKEFRIVEREDGTIAVLAGDTVIVDSGVTPVTAIPSAAVAPSPGAGTALQLGGTIFPRQPVANGIVIWGESLAAMAATFQDSTTVRYLGNNWVAWGLHLAG